MRMEELKQYSSNTLLADLSFMHVSLKRRLTVLHGLLDSQRKQSREEESMPLARLRTARQVLSDVHSLTLDMQQRESERHEKKWSKSIKRVK